jgi:hypothetical protein
MTNKMVKITYNEGMKLYLKLCGRFLQKAR